jgi:GxxExxY protein
MNLSEKNYIFKNESYKIIGACMEVHRLLGKGLLEVVYKDAVEYEFINLGIPFEREKRYDIVYKDIVLPHYYHADFVVYDKIILEIKSQRETVENHFRYVINYLALSKCPLGLLINFGQDSLVTKRIIFSQTGK